MPQTSWVGESKWSYFVFSWVWYVVREKLTNSWIGLHSGIGGMLQSSITVR